MRVEKILLSMMVGVAGLCAQTTPPDFSGVYYPLNPFGRFSGGPAAGATAPRQGPPPRPTASAPLSDGSRGRTPDEPSLTPEYMAKWEMISKTRIAGSSEYDLTAKCLPPGMPGMMSMAYGMEVMQNKDKITFFSELNDALRRVYLDGRKPSQKVLDDPTYAGYSTGHWEGDTLVVDTVALRDNTFIEGFTPHSDAMTVHERIRLKEPGLLEDRHYRYRSQGADEALGDGENLSESYAGRRATTNCGSSRAPRGWVRSAK